MVLTGYDMSMPPSPSSSCSKYVGGVAHARSPSENNSRNDDPALHPAGLPAAFVVPDLDNDPDGTTYHRPLRWCNQFVDDVCVAEYAQSNTHRGVLCVNPQFDGTRPQQITPGSPPPPQHSAHSPEASNTSARPPARTAGRPEAFRTGRDGVGIYIFALNTAAIRPI